MVIMDKNDKKELINKLKLKNEISDILSREHKIYDDICWQGIGLRIIQIIYKPSFEQGYSWDIRNQNNTLVLYRSIISNKDENLLIPGYIQLNCEHNNLNDFITRLNNNKININTNYRNNNSIILDGSSYEILFINLQNSIKLFWHEEYPSDWNEIVKIVEEMINYFMKLEPIKNNF